LVQILKGARHHITMNTAKYREYVQHIADLYEYPDGAAEALLKAYDIITAADSVLAKYVDLYDSDTLSAFRDPLDEIAKEAEEKGAEPYAAQLLLFICCSRRLKERYKEAGIDEKIYFDTVADLKWKLIECYKLHGIWGSFVAGWFAGFYNMTRFTLGRLQFELINFPCDYEKDGNVIKKGEKAINVHIPSSGHMDHELCMESYKMAADFFKDAFQGRKTVFHCYSWLLFPHNREILSPKSNIISFMNDYDIFEKVWYEDYNELWRFFYVKYDGDPDKLPNELSMQRGYIKWIKEGNKTGAGRGVMFL